MTAMRSVTAPKMLTQTLRKLERNGARLSSLSRLAMAPIGALGPCSMGHEQDRGGHRAPTRVSGSVAPSV
jgi:hypothetical protein